MLPAEVTALSPTMRAPRDFASGRHRDGLRRTGAEVLPMRVLATGVNWGIWSGAPRIQVPRVVLTMWTEL